MKNLPYFFSQEERLDTVFLGNSVLVCVSPLSTNSRPHDLLSPAQPCKFNFASPLQHNFPNSSQDSLDS